MAKSRDTEKLTKGTAPTVNIVSKQRYDFGEVTPAVHKSMQGNKRRDTKPELIVRRMLREMGYTGYRLDWKKAIGHPDIAFPGRKIAIFTMGCFWHAHEGCKYASTPAKNADYWEAKFARNRERDRIVRETLEGEGWDVVTIWECELKKDRLEETRARLKEHIEYAFVDLPSNDADRTGETENATAKEDAQ